jgi:uncharacterized protein
MSMIGIVNRKSKIASRKSSCSPSLPFISASQPAPRSKKSAGRFYPADKNMSKKKQLETFKTILQKQFPLLKEQYAVATLEVFGSYVRHEEKTDSDLDILVTFNEAPSLLKFIRLERQLSELLGVKVDLVLKDSLKPAIGERILQEAEPVT